MPDQGTCGSCGAPVFWMATCTGGRMPIDCEPVAAGNCLILEGDVVEVLGKKGAEVARVNGETLYQSHFASCSAAAKWRKRKGKR